MKKTILFTGGSGLLAINWAVQIAGSFDVVLVLHKRNISVPGVRTITVDLEDEDLFSATLQSIQPFCVVHCAGLTSVEACEKNPELARHVNVGLSVAVAKACVARGIQLVYISTDHFFSGSQPLVSEEAIPAPVNIYSETKLVAEKKLLVLSDEILIIRTNFFGWGPSYRHSLSDMIVHHLRKEKTVQLFEDVFYTPILINELAEVVMELIDKSAQGIFNVVGNERISKFEFGIRLVKRFQLNEKLVKPVNFLDRKDLVKRPLDLSLSNKKVVSFLKRDIGDINNNILKLYEQEQNGFAQIIQNI